MIIESLARFLVASHKVNPIRGNVLALGKQTIGITLSKALEIFQEQDCEVNPNFNLDDIKSDSVTRMRLNNLMDDESFFRLFGDVNYQTMDVSDYEQASIIHNLNDPIPQNLEESFDFIIDGGTFDHLFDLKTSFANVVKLLKPKGRVFQWNAASNYSNAGYLSFSADFFYDYYALNNFSDCQTFFAQSYFLGAQNWFISKFVPPAKSQRYPEFKQSYFYSMVIVLATKGESSTYDQIPIQLQYRDANLIEAYQKTVEKFDSQQLPLKPIPKRSVQMPWKYKFLYFFEPKSDSKVYQRIGWL